MDWSGTLQCVFVGAVAAFAIGCGGESTGTSSGGVDCDSGDTFTPYTASFAGFRDWEAFPVMAPVDQASVHTNGPRTEYLNERPMHGSKKFPVGTIIVKEVEVGDLKDRKVFAMVKRGGCFNEGGALGWEWFELINKDEQVATIHWHGTVPPPGDQYANSPGGDCNTCHEHAPNNDFVQSKSLQLSNF